MPAPLHVGFAAGPSGPWRIERITALIGEGLADAERLEVLEAQAAHAPRGSWLLRGVTSNARYTNRPEVDALGERQEGLGRPRATRAALIPIRKSEAWWALAQDERRAIFEQQSRHIGIGMDYLPGIARRLHHCRELSEPFDFLTCFEFAPADESSFDTMLARLRATPNGVLSTGRSRSGCRGETNS